jgi:serine/threonine protein kinase/Tfp pilus assembly protein PilF
LTIRESQVISHYRLVRQIGEGGMGVVWQAMDERLDRPVALKFLPADLAHDPGQLARLQQEARAVAALNHANIVTIYDIEKFEGQRFLAMEFIDGSPLSDLIPEDGLPLDEILRLAIPLCDAISKAHEQGIAHGDLKPRNIMITTEKHIKLLDFGLARSLDPEASTREVATQTTEPLSAQQHVSGTLPYMSPEQLRGARADHGSDIFSLGVILHEMATGDRPFTGRTVSDVVASILKDPPRLVTELRPSLPREYGKAVEHCLQKDPSRRMPSVLHLRSELETIREDAASGMHGTEASIAILPFVDMSAEKDQGYFCEGTAEEIINALSRIHGLRVASRTSSFRFKHAAIDSREIGRRLGVRSLLEGSVRKAGRRLRIAVQLTDAEKGFQRWSELYDREMEDIFAIQEEIARSVVEAMELTLTPQERTALGAKQTHSVRAYDYYLRGRQFYYQYRRRGIEFALQMFERALELDPDYANAYAGVADCCTFLYLHKQRRAAYRERALASSRRALELAPESALVHTALGAALSMAGHHQAAESEFEAAIVLDPRLYDAHYFYARDCFAQGEFQKAARLFEKASRLRQEDYLAPLLAAQAYDILRKPDLARDRRLKGVRQAKEHLQVHPDDIRALYFAANALVVLGEVQRGLDWSRRALEMEPDDSMLRYNVGCIQSLAGQMEEALDSLEEAARLGLTYKEWYEMDGNLDPLRDHPRFMALLRSLEQEPGSS